MCDYDDFICYDGDDSCYDGADVLTPEEQKAFELEALEVAHYLERVFKRLGGSSLDVENYFKPIKYQD